MSTTVKGIYRDGQVHLLEKLEGVENVEVVVTFPDTDHMIAGATSGEARRLNARTWLRVAGWNLGGAPYPTRDELHDRTR